ncbi:auxin-responsive protein IAA12-like isoform X1 [Lolium perenne]|uniref:auxin-responsive protein IAA12-like isoform X2 n=1 Tax=Lolium perenne TaxID=4522 RepID=UPI0021E9EA08|nr:auxin-responsive protein IAA12-like isoform X1 [Lolium perenne]XP_051179360.1 auxin-responsive protein IAA12-like isoform X2 [Lolium perenne]
MEAAVGYVSGDADSLLMATELRLGLPGTDDQKPKTTFSPPATPRGKKRTADAFEDSAAAEAHKADDDVEAAPPVAKAQVVGWPPVRSYRKSCFQAAASKSKAHKKAEDASSNSNAPSAAATAAPASTNGGSFVKVSMDGAPYLRKIDMRMYKGYRELREALEAMFVCFSGADTAASNPCEYAITYEDKDGDLMLVGDVPFDMFSGTCKKLRIIKRSEATGLGSK